MTETIKKQILDIRDSGETNMFDTNAVQAIASRKGYFELFTFIEKHRSAYAEFIMHGD